MPFRNINALHSVYVLSDELQAYETAKATAESEGKSRFDSRSVILCMSLKSL